MTRGERNHNPGNVRKSSIAWQGKVAGNDPAFETFVDDFSGIRAIAKILLSYQNKYGLKTPQQIINRWAPPSENQTGAYVASVCKDCGIKPTSIVNLKDVDQLVDMVKAIIKQENGEVIYPQSLIESAVKSALGVTA